VECGDDQIRVPEDDVTTRIYYYTVFKPLTEVAAPPQEEVPVYQIPLYDDQGNFRVDVIEVQDLAMWVVQGPIADRTKEKLGTSDVGIVKLRKLYETEMAKVAKGLDPMCTVRDPAANVEIELPQERHAFGSASDFLSTVLGGGLINFSPLLDQVVTLFTDADKAATPNAPAYAGAPPADEPLSPDLEY